MSAWQPDSTIPGVGRDGVPTVNWAGPAGAPLDFDLIVPDGQQSDTWLGQVRVTPDADAVVATFEDIAWGSPFTDADGNDVVEGTVTLLTTALTAGVCYCYELAHDAGQGYEPVLGGALSPSISIARP